MRDWMLAAAAIVFSMLIMVWAYSPPRGAKSRCELNGGTLILARGVWWREWVCVSKVRT
jgi:hypothetical protein